MFALLTISPVNFCLLLLPLDGECIPAVLGRSEERGQVGAPLEVGGDPVLNFCPRLLVAIQVLFFLLICLGGGQIFLLFSFDPRTNFIQKINDCLAEYAATSNWQNFDELLRIFFTNEQKKYQKQLKRNRLKITKHCQRHNAPRLLSVILENVFAAKIQFSQKRFK